MAVTAVSAADKGKSPPPLLLAGKNIRHFFCRCDFDAKVIHVSLLMMNSPLTPLLNVPALLTRHLRSVLAHEILSVQSIYSRQVGRTLSDIETAAHQARLGRVSALDKIIMKINATCLEFTASRRTFRFRC